MTRIIGLLAFLALCGTGCAAPAAPALAANGETGAVPIGGGTAETESVDANALAGAGREALARGDYQEAAAQLARALEARPGDAMLMSDLGLAYAAMGRYADGRTQLRGIMRLMTECAGSCPERGTIQAAFTRLEGRLGVP